MKILIIGGGNMGHAYATCLLAKKITNKGSLRIVESNGPRQKFLRRAHRCRVWPQVPENISQYQVVILSLKPQDMRLVCERLANKVSNDQLVISVMAGIQIGAIRRIIGNSNVVRCMPNLPAKLRLGMTAYYIPKSLAPNLAKIARLVLGSTGEALELPAESRINHATALSGCGPAYVFYLIEHLLGAAEELGFTHDEARVLVFQTLIGSTHLWHQSGETAQALRERVTSKKGATYAAFKVFKKGEIGHTLRAGIRAALRRSKELAKFADTARRPARRARR